MTKNKSTIKDIFNGKYLTIWEDENGYICLFHTQQ